MHAVIIVLKSLFYILVLQDIVQGYGILVSTVPKETNATYSLKKPFEICKNDLGREQDVILFVHKLRCCLLDAILAMHMDVFYN